MNADLLLYQFKDYEIGIFNCPFGPNPNAFLLQSLMNSFTYHCDEMVFDYLALLRQVKQLFEGSRTLITDVKHKDAVPITPRPLYLL